MPHNLTPAVEQALNSVTAKQVLDLRERSGEGMMKCKEILASEAFDKAIAAVETLDDIGAMLEAATTVPQLKAVMGLMLERLA